jgi:hypothetical protein
MSKRGCNRTGGGPVVADTSKGGHFLGRKRHLGGASATASNRSAAEDIAAATPAIRVRSRVAGALPFVAEYSANL